MQLVIVTGMSGAGKSRVFDSLARTADCSARSAFTTSSLYHFE